MNSCDFSSKANNDDFDDVNSPKVELNESSNIEKNPKFDMISPIRNLNNNNQFEKEEEEDDEDENEDEEKNDEQEKEEEKRIDNRGKYFQAEKTKMSKKDIDILVDNKKSELNIKIFDMVTKNQIEEKKIEELYENEEDEEKKGILLKELEDLIKSNENNINEIKG
jgi:hypothetical protein